MVERPTTDTKTLKISEQIKAPALFKRKLWPTVMLALIVIVIVVVSYLVTVHSSNSKNKAKVQTQAQQQASFNKTLATTDMLTARGKYTQAIQQLNSTPVSNNTEKVYLLSDEANVYIQEKQYTSALNSLLQAYNTDSSVMGPTVIASIASIYQMEGNKTQAIAFYNNAITAAKNSPNNVSVGLIPTYQAAISSLEKN